MSNKILGLLPVAIIVIALVVSMYLVFNTDTLLASKANTATKQFVAGASCPAPESPLISNEDKEIHFVGCGGFF